MEFSIELDGEGTCPNIWYRQNEDAASESVPYCRYKITVSNCENESDNGVYHISGCYGGIVGTDEEVYYLNPHNQFASFLDKKKSGGVTLKKAHSKTDTCLIADPGLYFKLDFNEWKALRDTYIPGSEYQKYLRRDLVQTVKARVYVNAKIESKEPFQSYFLITISAKDKNKDVKIEDKNYLDIDHPMDVVIPFVDTGWNQHVNGELTVNLVASLYYGPKRTCIDIPIYFPPFRGSAKSIGRFTCGYIKEKMPKEIVSMNEGEKIQLTIFEDELEKYKKHLRAQKEALIIYEETTKYIDKESQTDWKSLSIKNIIYTEKGVWFEVHYPFNQPMRTRLVKEYTHTIAYSQIRPHWSSDNQDVLDYYESCFLPYPKLRGQEIVPLDHKIEIIGDFGTVMVFDPKMNGIQEHYKDVFIINFEDGGLESMTIVQSPSVSQ